MIICEWKRKKDKISFFEFEFNSMLNLADFFDTFFKRDISNEQIELRIYKKQDVTK